MSNFRLASNRNQISAIDFIQLGSTANKLAAYTKSKKVKRLEASLTEKPIFRFFRFFGSVFGLFRFLKNRRRFRFRFLKNRGFGSVFG
jgi:hypothetical protein